MEGVARMPPGLASKPTWYSARMSVFKKRELIQQPQLSAEERLEAVLGLMAAGIQLHRASARRRWPQLDSAAIDARIRAYLAADAAPDPGVRRRPLLLGD